MRRRIAILAGLLALGSLLAGCSDDQPNEYNAEVEDNFVRTCSEQGEQGGGDLELVCQCAYDKFREEIPFERFQEFDEKLRDDPEAELPDDFINLYTDCVLEQGGGAAGSTPTLPTTTTAPAPTTAAPTTAPPG